MGMSLLESFVRNLDSRTGACPCGVGGGLPVGAELQPEECVDPERRPVQA